MSKLAALLAAGIIAAIPFIAQAGSDANCPDFTGDGRVTTMDLLFVIDNYQQPKGNGTFYAVTDLLAAVQHYGEFCS
jgi:hypothetical protein